MLVDRVTELAKSVSAQVQKLTISEARPARLEVILWALVILLTIFISLFRFDAYQAGTSMDDAHYIILARSLVSSPIYGLINAPGDPSIAKYPFGYPLILAPFALLFPNNLIMMQVPSLIATLLNSALLFWGWRWLYPQKSSWWGLAISALYALSPLAIDHTRRVMSEPVFTFFCLLALVLTERYVQGKRSAWSRLWLSVTLVGVVFTRTVGVELVALVFLYLLWKTGRAFWKTFAVIVIQMAVVIGLVVVLTPVQLRDLLPLEYLKDENARFLESFFTGSTTNQPDTFTSESNPAEPAAVTPTPPQSTSVSVLLTFGIQHHFGHDLRNTVILVGGGTAEDMTARAFGIPWLPLAFGYFVSGVIAVGFVVLLRQNRMSLFLIFAIFYFAASFIWVWDSIRLLYPIQPQIQLAFLAGIEAILVLISRILRKKPLQQYVMPAVCVLLIVAAAYKSMLIDDSRIHAGDLQVRTSWLASQAAPSDIIMSELPQIDYLYSGRKTVSYPSVTTSSSLEGYLKNNRIKYVLVAPKLEWAAVFQPHYSDATQKLVRLLDELQSNNRVQLAFSSEQDRVMVYRVLS